MLLRVETSVVFHIFSKCSIHDFDVTPDVHEVLTTVNFCFYHVMVYTIRFPTTDTHFRATRISQTSKIDE